MRFDLPFKEYDILELRKGSKRIMIQYDLFNKCYKITESDIGLFKVSIMPKVRR